MSLKVFHIAFILISAVLCIWVGGWCLTRYMDTEMLGYMYGGAVSLFFSFALVVYLGWAVKKMQKFGYLSLALVLLAPKSALACAVCYGDPNNPLVQSANTGVGFFLGIVVLMLSTFGGLFLVWRRRARLYGGF